MKTKIYEIHAVPNQVANEVRFTVNSRITEVTSGWTLPQSLQYRNNFNKIVTYNVGL